MTLSAAFLFGLMGGAHCIGMCGGIMSTLSLASGRNVWLNLIAYNSGRIFSYSVAGALVALLGSLLSDQLLSIGVALRILASIMLILMALYIANWWKGLTQVEKLGRYLWRYLQPIASKLMPVRTTSQALTLGLVWGWLPCGLVYSVLIWSMSSGSSLQGALIMLCFGLGTLPAMILTGRLAYQVKQLSQSKLLRSLAALIIISFAIWQLVPLITSTVTHTEHIHG